MNENYTFEELIVRSGFCSELLAVIKKCETEGLTAAATLGAIEGHIDVVKTFCEVRINSELERMEKEMATESFYRT